MSLFIIIKVAPKTKPKPAKTDSSFGDSLFDDADGDDDIFSFSAPRGRLVGTQEEWIIE